MDISERVFPLWILHEVFKKWSKSELAKEKEDGFVFLLFLNFICLFE